MFDSLLLVSLFLSLLAGQFARIELFQGLINVYVQEGIIFIYICWSIHKFGLKPVQNFFKQKLVALLFFLFVVSYIVSIVNFTIVQNSVAFLYFLRLTFYTLFAVYLFNAFQKKKKIVQLDLYLNIFSIVLLILSGIQYFFFPNFWGLYRLGWDPHLYRVSATFIDVYVAAAIYGLFALFWFQKNKKIMALCFMIALIGTFSRSAYVSFVVTSIVLFVTQKRWKELGIVLFLFALIVVLVPKPFGEGVNLLRTASITSRIKDYQIAFSLWRSQPLVGYGYNRIAAVKEQRNLVLIDNKSHSLSSFHNSFLILLVTIGAVGLGVVFILFGTWVKAYSYLRPYLMYMCCMSLFDNVLLHVLVLLPLFFILCERYHSSLE
jgi:O-antigen ligase